MRCLIITLISFITLYFSAQAEVISIAINSGNPAFPFPQFQPYQNASGTLSNLANHNGVGVPHAEMEQTIRDAYRIMMNRASYTGATLSGVKYIKFTSSPDCSEGSGYALLAAAALADKTTFDGLWLWLHDNAMNKVVSYSTGNSAPAYNYSTLPGWQNISGGNSATDGDVDFALALYTAYRQWGEFMLINDSKGNPISYKHDCIEFLKGMTDTLLNPANGNYMCGDIGLDGYLKNGDSWGETTDWASSIARSGFPRLPEAKGPQLLYFDYSAPSYFHQFADFLTKESPTTYAWNIKQFQRAEASCDWLMGQLLPNQNMIPFAGHADIPSTNVPVFSQYNEGEDFRLAWRTILNYVWNGNPSYTWDPSSHLVKAATQNTFERDIGLRYAKFLWKPQDPPWSNPCVFPKDGFPLSFWGPAALWTNWKMDGSGGNFFPLNWIKGTGSPSAVVAQDFNLMAELYRQCEVVWQADIPGDGYLTAVPHYFHEWFRLLGMLVLTGNYQPPSAMKRNANMKVYMSVDKTFGFEKDTIKYTIGYRNYGSDTARTVTIIDTLHNDFIFVSASRGGVFNPASNTVTWSIGNVPFYQKDDTKGPTQDSVNLVIKVGKATLKQYRNRATITCSNGTGWTSNEYPNHITSVMERNYLDIAKRALLITKTASAKRVKPGSQVQISINFENTSEAGWINGGRPGVHFSFSRGDNIVSGHECKMRFRLFHDADEGYIDYGNYRFSYFLYDSLTKCYKDSSGCTNGWSMRNDITEGVDPNYVKIFQENITPGKDSLGRRWNQRLVVQFSDPSNPNRKINLAAIDWLLLHDAGNLGTQIHKGGMYLLRLVRVLTNDYAGPAAIWNDDWSWDPASVDIEDGLYWPITNDWTDPDKPDVPVTTWNPKGCETATHTVNNILVEEWDGYTWRRVAGNGPMPGRDASNVVIRDTIPAGFHFGAFSGTPPLGIAPVVVRGTVDVVSWTKPTLQIKEKGTITYTMIADNGSCPGTPDRTTVNRAWISADKESPFADSAIVTISCDTVVKPPTPDHLDIILDTTNIDQLTDAPLVRITLDAGTKTAVAYAVVRDASGNYLSHASNLTWTSRDPSVATVAGSGWQVTATKAGVGATFIVVSSPGLKPDSLAITTEATPPWPAIVWATMVDNDANLIPDMLVMTLTDTFHVNQQLDSIVIVYRGNTYSIAFTPAILTGTVLSVPFASLTGVDAVPTGQVTIVMTVEGNEKRVTKTFTDGIGPQIRSAILLQNANSAKSMLLVAFSEPVQPQRIKGQTLQGIIVGRSDTLLFTVDSTIPRGGDSIFAIHAVSGTTVFSVGDRIRLTPGSGGIKDVAGNTPHPLNPFVTISQGPTPAEKAVYFDGNADGYVDSVVISFGRAVSASALVASFDWSDCRTDTLGTPSLGYYRGDSAKVAVRIDNKLTPRVLKTATLMASTLFFRAFPEEKQSLWVIDSAAPVLTEAVFCPGSAIPSTTTMAPDTISVKFSEASQQFGQTTPLQFISAASGTPYSISLSYLSGNSADFSMRFLVTSAPGNFTVADGDSVWMSIGAFGDMNSPSVVQQNPNNRRVALHLKSANSPVVVVLSQNPFTPSKTGGPLKIDVHYLAPVSFASSLQASAKIYDALGNCVYMIDHFAPQPPNAVIGNWPGVNLSNRQVGTGTYLGIIHVQDGKGVNFVKKVLIGVKR